MSRFWCRTVSFSGERADASPRRTPTGISGSRAGRSQLPRQRFSQVSIGVGITGVAGPGGGTEAKPVGLVYISVSDAQKTETVERKFPGDRDRIRWYASQQALDLVRRRLM